MGFASKVSRPLDNGDYFISQLSPAANNNIAGSVSNFGGDGVARYEIDQNAEPEVVEGESGTLWFQQPMAAALSLAKAGCPVFPCRPSDDRDTGRRAKSPLIDGGFKNATTDEDTIQSWWRKWPDAVIGVPTGSTTRFFVFDVDNKDNRDGKASLRALELEHGPLPATKRVRTPLGGEHFYFEMPEEVDIRNSSDKIGSGLDIRANGGYVVVPPSRLIDDHGSIIGQYEEAWGALILPPLLPIG